MRLGWRLAVLVGMLMVIGSVPATAAAQSSADCANPATGTASGDAPTLTEGNDAYDGMGGGDVLNGRGGHDCLIGGAGGDHLSGGTGNDDLTGGEGSDYLSGGAGNDTIDAFDGSGGDYVTCGSGTDTVYADPGDYVAGDCETVVRGPRATAPTAQQICEDAGGTFEEGGTGVLWRCEAFSVGQPLSDGISTDAALRTACANDGGSPLGQLIGPGGVVTDSETVCFS